MRLLSFIRPEARDVIIEISGLYLRRSLIALCRSPRWSGPKDTSND